MKAKKQYGQNFLVDKNIINQIISLIKLDENSLIIEIGPGRGALTEYLVKLKANLLCIEIDTDMKKFLDKYESDKCEIVYTDILDFDLKAKLETYNYKRLIIVGNLPYYITSPIMEHIIKSTVNPNQMIFMVQKEVAERYSAKAKSKDYGYMTVFLQHYYDVELKINVPNYCFNPPPKVESAVIELINNNKSYDLDNTYFDFVKSCFRLKRKTLRNNLRDYDWDKILKVLLKNNLLDTVRAEELSEDIIIEIYKTLHKL